MTYAEKLAREIGRQTGYHVSVCELHAVQALSAIAALATETGVSLSQTDWRPIGKEQKNGKPFIALSPKGVSACRWSSVDCDDDRSNFWWEDPYDLCLFEDGPADAPTHYIPMPQPPEGGAK